MECYDLHVISKALEGQETQKPTELQSCPQSERDQINEYEVTQFFQKMLQKSDHSEELHRSPDTNASAG